MSPASQHSPRPVHICLSDTGWILERLARELSTRLPYVSFGTEPDPAATIQYYMTYGCRRQRVSPIEVALFTHKEEDPHAARLFESTAREVDHRVAMSEATRRLVAEVGVDHISTIEPGVDLERFRPKLKIGVVGRTYHTGRKGEALVAQVMDLPDIEWHFTGQGWPGPAEPIAEESMPDFYRSLDYVLVPSLNEGGPMCVLEALACGCAVIAPPVGWVTQYPHIEFRRGDAGDLRRVLQGLLEVKWTLHRSVAERTWEAWAEQHDRLLRTLLDAGPEVALRSSAPAAASIPATAPSLGALLVLHGDEARSAGGPSVRVPRTVAELQRLGERAAVGHGLAADFTRADLVHAFNVWRPASCDAVIRQAEMLQRPTVLSPILMDLSEPLRYSSWIRAALDSDTDSSAAAKFQALREALAEHRRLPLEQREPFSGYFAAVRRLCRRANHLILLSEHERNLLSALGVQRGNDCTIVPNAVDAERFAQADPRPFVERFGVSDFVLCVGRIETRKNQATLAYALRGLGVPLVLVGQDAEPTYTTLVRKWARSNVIFTGHLPQSDPMLASAYAAARVFCLPSWSEGAPLAALEAGAAGCGLVLSDRSAEREYFGTDARYADPADPDSIRQHILDALNDPQADARAAAVLDRVRTSFNWGHHARLTRDTYRKVLADLRAPSRGARARRPPSRLLVDLTASLGEAGPRQAAARADLCLALTVAALRPAKVQLMMWAGSSGSFIAIDPGDLGGPTVSGIPTGADKPTPQPLALSAEDTVAVLGSMRLCSDDHLQALRVARLSKGLRLIAGIDDLSRQSLRHLLTSVEHAEISARVQLLLSIVDAIIVPSDRVANQLRALAGAVDVPVPHLRAIAPGADAVISAAPRMPRMWAASGAPPAFVLWPASDEVAQDAAFVASLWTRLLLDHGDRAPHLVVVATVSAGRPFQMSPLLDPSALRGRVTAVLDETVEELAWLYRHCLFTLDFSAEAGWSTGVTTGLALGKTALISEACVAAETAAGIVEQVAAQDLHGWQRAVMRLVFAPDWRAHLEARARSFAVRHWTTAAEEWLEACSSPTVRRRFPPLDIGQIVDFRAAPSSNHVTAHPYQLDGWGQPEAPGCWTIGDFADLAFEIDTAPANGLVLLIVAHALCEPGAHQSVKLSVNGSTFDTCPIGDQPVQVQALVPAELIPHSGELVLRLTPSAPSSPRSLGWSDDERRLGLMCSTLVLEPLLVTAGEAWVRPRMEASALALTLQTSTQDSRPRFLCFELSDPALDGLTCWLNGRVALALPCAASGATTHFIRVAPSEFVPGRPLTLTWARVSGSRLHCTRVGLFHCVPAEVDLGSSGIETHTFTESFHTPGPGPLETVAAGTLVEVSPQTLSLAGWAGQWHGVESSGIWTDGSGATLRLAATGLSECRFVGIRISCQIASAILELGGNVEIAVGGNTPHRIEANANAAEFATPVEVALTLPSSLSLDSQGQLAITIRSNLAVRPQQLGIDDSRLLAVRLVAVRCDPVFEQALQADALPILAGQRLTPFDVMGRGLRRGWHEPEADGTWSDGARAHLKLQLLKDDPSSSWPTARLDLLPFEGALVNGQLPLSIRAGNMFLGRYVLDGRSPSVLALPALDALVDPDGCVELTIQAACSARPSDHFETSDTRDISFKLRAVTAA